MNNLTEFLTNKGLTKEVLSEFGAIIWSDGTFSGPRSEWVNIEVIEVFENGPVTNTIRKVIERKAYRYKMAGAQAAVFVPAFSLRGDFYGLSIRVIGSDEIKHDSYFLPTVKKQNIVFNLNKCYQDVAAKKAVFVCEGAYDAIALSAAGQKNAICLLGTSHSPKQLFQLRCFADKMVFCTDPDAAGYNTISKIITDYNGWFDFYRVDILTDPDEYLAKNSIEDLRKTIVKIDTKQWLQQHPIRTKENK